MTTLAGKLMPKRDATPEVTITSIKDETRTMKSVQWFGTKDIRVVEVPVPKVTDEGDVILRVTTTAICGSDLHFYNGAMPGMKKGDIVGHEFMGVVEAAGPNVKKFSVGDRVVVAFDIGSDVNCLKVPEGMPDDKVIFLSDIMPTGWHGAECGQVGEGDNVAIWGAGPVGLLAAQSCYVRGAAKVAIIDSEQYRLDYAVAKLPGIHTVNFKEVKVLEALHKIFPVGPGPDVAIEAVGLHYATSWLHKIEKALMLETDPSEVLNEMIEATRKHGRISVIGAYAGYCNHFNIGAFMEKSMTMSGGQTPCQKYWPTLVKLMQASPFLEGKLDPTIVKTHELPLEQAPEAYKMFDEKTDEVVKVVLKPALKGE
ncbi:S-(hydroxymethyl)glutathione dehydrogenase [Auxenochlorella protothecoides]|uniref:S-(Hydroxymethyl)glutathione dehydrogenase n=1 Tax=Auxenochlorella protothecoides TaxID=3075 RepID=A0A087SKZ0_AUXPR|nr:S-(hydroxymethyl)glutathione dehydrogenase [Auxenochlorella protothecoides]KFM26394.1 S-(hydroxymethyl)glutathione dehydrogenase [Auxenochlorella protothecoides]